MSGLLSYVLGANWKAQRIGLQPVDIHHVDTNPDRRARSLKHLLKANHVNYSVVYRGLMHTNINSHILISAYLLGAPSNQLHGLYEEQVKELEAWAPSPAELIDNDWVDFLGDARYQRAFVDFFEDKLAMDYSYDWKKVVEYYLFSSDRPLVHSLICGFGDPLVQLAYAYEMDSKELAMEALTLACVKHDFLEKYCSDSKFANTRPAATSNSIFNLMTDMSQDTAFDDVSGPGADEDLEGMMKRNEELIMKYWNAWEVSDPLRDFQDSQTAVVALLLSSADNKLQAHSFFMVGLLTSSYAVRVLLPVLPERYHMSLVQQWWLLAIVALIVEGRPRPKPLRSGSAIELGDGGWKHVQERALKSQCSNDAHYIQAVRTIRALADTWGDENGGYLGAAATFVDSFKLWERKSWKLQGTG